LAIVNNAEINTGSRSYFLTDFLILQFSLVMMYFEFCMYLTPTYFKTIVAFSWIFCYTQRNRLNVSQIYIFLIRRTSETSEDMREERF
jgi:hypothetical protein